MNYRTVEEQIAVIEHLHAKATLGEVAALFVRKDSAYKAIAGVDAWDVMRNARYFEGSCPVVAHPPCSQWGGLRHMARKDDAEKYMARSAVAWVRLNGGVLEHPKGSTLWSAEGLPEPFIGVDRYGGYTIEINQWHWGHVVNKPTWLYIVGCPLAEIPPIPYREGKAERVISTGHGLRQGDPGWRSRVTQKEREYTPPALAEWLVEIARRCSTHTSGAVNV